MNWEALGAVAELLGSIAVLVTLIYLARQIRQSNTLARRSENNMTHQQTSAFRRSIALDADVAELWSKGVDDYSGLSRVERLRFHSLASDNFWNAYQIWDRVDHEVFDSEDWDRTRKGVADLLKREGMAQWWNLNKSQFPERFVTELDDHIGKLHT